MKIFEKPLTAAEERYYLLKLRDGDEKAQEVLIRRNMRLVAHMVKKYTSSDMETEDMISIGTIGLIKAIKSYNIDKGSRFATYAAKCIDNATLSQMRLWFRTNPPRAKKNQNGVFWHRFLRTYTSFVPPRTAM